MAAMERKTERRLLAGNGLHCWLYESFLAAAQFTIFRSEKQGETLTISPFVSVISSLDAPATPNRYSSPSLKQQRSGLATCWKQGG